MYLNLTLVTMHGEKSLAAMISSVLLLGLLIFGIIKGRHNRLVRIFSLYAAAIFFWDFGIYQLTVAKDAAQGLFWVRFLNVSALFIPCTFFHFVEVLVHPDSTLKNRPSIFWGYFTSVIFALISHSKYFISGTITVPSFYYYPDTGILYKLSTLSFSFFVGWGLFKLYTAYIHSNGQRRNQFKYVFVAYMFKVAGGAQTYLPSLGLPMWQHAMQGLPVGTFVLYYAILAHRLMDINVIIRKTLIYSIVTGSLGAIYLAIVTVGTHIFEDITGSQTVFSPAIAAATIVIGFQPIRKRVQAFIDSKFFRQYVDREEKLYELSREVVTHTTSEAMSDALMRVLNETLHPKHGALYLRRKDGGGFHRVSSLGDIPLREIMAEDNTLAMYFVDHPQPFVQDLPENAAESHNTRQLTPRVKVA